jgi:hypothetical protein
MPVILATQAVETRRIQTQDQPRQKVSETPSQSISQVCACDPSYEGGSQSEAGPKQKARPYLKNNYSKKELEIWLK